MATCASRGEQVSLVPQRSGADPDLADSKGERSSALLGLMLSQRFLEDMSLSPWGPVLPLSSSYPN